MIKPMMTCGDYRHEICMNCWNKLDHLCPMCKKIIRWKPIKYKTPSTQWQIEVTTIFTYDDDIQDL